MGWIENGVYHRGDAPKVQLSSRQNSTFKQHDHKRQVKDFSREIVQPYNKDGSANQQFIDAYPEESKNYGFLPSDEQLRKG